MSEPVIEAIVRSLPQTRRPTFTNGGSARAGPVETVVWTGKNGVQAVAAGKAFASVERRS